MYPGQRARFAPPLQMYKDYPTAPNPMYRPPRPAQMSPGYYSPMHDPSGPQLSQCNQDSHTPQRDSSEKQGNHKSDQTKEIPPLFQKQKQQKMEMAAAQNQNIEIIQFQRLPSRHRSAQNQRHPSLTIHETNIDAGSVLTCY
uniref:uncharacterized protein LOC120334187 isoform X1 n=1 Tax=Styela clava TaxID=7725 RepID=UPI0019392B3A|nr:uncharacterized protein LOC120334187 isoform X1 [Styela clava]